MGGPFIQMDHSLVPRPRRLQGNLLKGGNLITMGSDLAPHQFNKIHIFREGKLLFDNPVEWASWKPIIRLLGKQAHGFSPNPISRALIPEKLIPASAPGGFAFDIFSKGDGPGSGHNMDARATAKGAGPTSLHVIDNIQRSWGQKPFQFSGHGRVPF